MTDRDRYIPCVSSWADAVYADPAAAAAFYAELFGWDCENTMPADAPGAEAARMFDSLIVPDVRPSVVWSRRATPRGPSKKLDSSLIRIGDISSVWIRLTCV